MKTTPVGYYDGSNHAGFQTRTNGNLYGIFDLAGNVREIMNDCNNATQQQPQFRGGSYLSGTSGVDVNELPPAANGGTEDGQTGFRVLSTWP